MRVPAQCAHEWKMSRASEGNRSVTNARTEQKRNRDAHPQRQKHQSHEPWPTPTHTLCPSSKPPSNPERKPAVRPSIHIPPKPPPAPLPILAVPHLRYTHPQSVPKLKPTTTTNYTEEKNSHKNQSHLLSSLITSSSASHLLSRATLSALARLAASSPTKYGSSSGRTRVRSSSSIRSNITLRISPSNAAVDCVVLVFSAAALARRRATFW